MTTSTAAPPDRTGPGRVGETIAAVSLPVIVGLLVRAVPTIPADFPLNDGGLIYALVRDLEKAGFVLPATTTYNGLALPFAYPPLGFYLAGGLSTVFGIDLLFLFRFLPLVVSVATIPVVYLLAREILPTRFQALLATWAFALVPRAFAWLIVGGGVTRSVGLLFAILAILEGVRLFRTHRRIHVAGAAVFAALTVLTHPPSAEFMAISYVLILLAFGRTWRGFREFVAVVGVSAILIAPWVVAVVSVHGVGPFLSGGQTGLNVANGIFYLLTFNFTDEPFLPLLGALGLLGLVNAVASRRFLLPAWVAVLFLIDPRASATTTMVPLVMLIAMALDEVVLGRLHGAAGSADSDAFWPPAVVRDRFAQLALAVVLSVGLIGGLLANITGGSPMKVLPEENRAAMAWIATNTPPSARFVVATGSPWFVDATGEWFPVLADRTSVATLQGYEWLGKDRWNAQESANESLAQCAYKTIECFTDWVNEEAMQDAWVYVPVHTTYKILPSGDCCAVLRDGLAHSADYEEVYSGPGGVVYRPRS